MNNPTLTEFCFGMIGRADIEGSKSNVAMNAWLPQASSVIPAGGGSPRTNPFSALCRPVGGCTLSGGRSPYLKRDPVRPGHTHILASVEPPSCADPQHSGGRQGAESAADCLYSSGFYQSTLYRRPAGVLPAALGTEDLTRVPRIQMCCPNGGPEGTP